MPKKPVNWGIVQHSKSPEQEAFAADPVVFVRFFLNLYFENIGIYNYMKQKLVYFIVIFLIVASCIAFGRIAGNDFINLDDKEYITENNHVQSGLNKESIQWAVTAVVSSNWHPLTMLSHMLDWSLFGDNASGHHLVSLLLHIGAVIFLFLFLNKTTNHIWPSAFAAAFFALHPLRVESVAWASERKDVLSMFFGMACLYAYAFYAQKAKISRYLLCLILFVLALMSKPMMVTLPFVLMLLDYWPLNRWPKALDGQGKGVHSVGGLIGEKIPFICLTIISSIITFWAQNKVGSVTSANDLPFLVRSINAIIAYIAYLEKILWPFNLAAFYNYWLTLPLWKVLFSGIIITLITLTVLYYIKKLPFLFAGWFIYLGTLVPVIGLVQVGSQAMADRYTYMPSIGIAFMLAWGFPYLISKDNIRKKILFPAGFAILIFLSVLTWRQCGYWKNSITLWNHALQTTKDNYVAHRHLAAALTEEGKLNEAIYHYNNAIHLKPDYADAYFCRGNAFIRLGKYQSALNDFNKAISMDPASFDAYNNRGFIYLKLGRYQQAFDDYSKAISLKPDYADAWNNRAFVYLNTGDIASGCGDAQKACELGSCAALQAAAGKGLCR
jgi:tetratricopeptide (TPR) repeat protein